MRTGDGPVGAAFEQRSWVRPYRPGPWRLLLLTVLLAAGALTAALTVVAVALAAGWAALAVAAGLGLAAVTTLAWTAVRCWRVGVWVNDTGVLLVTLRAQRSWPWPAVAAVERGRGAVRLRLADGTAVTTPLHARSPDFLGRPQAFDAAATAVGTWHRETRRTG